MPVNYFALASVPLYLGASITSAYATNWPLAGVWFFYSVANACLVYGEYKGVG